VKPCLDPSLPEGHAFWVATHSQPQGHFFLSGTASKTRSLLNSEFLQSLLNSLEHERV